MCVKLLLPILDSFFFSECISQITWDCSKEMEGYCLILWVTSPGTTALMSEVSDIPGDNFVSTKYLVMSQDRLQLQLKLPEG